ncbi:MAG: hypothetical protein IT184_19005 [Acidobacteria bacterium]|nr:hypothetical protein [Acidobacteriota bacterium]
MVDIVWSPLYTAFYGTVYALLRDAYAATTVHRVAIVLAATAGVLAVMRRLLPPALALLVAVWWAVMPINFNTLYEVHLFALLPLLAILLIVGHVRGSVGRGLALGVFLTSAVLVRNELFLASGLFACLCGLAEIRSDKARKEWRGVSGRLAWYLAPMMVAAVVCTMFLSRSIVRGPALSAHVAAKHTVNMCQVYAFGYSQRHPEWHESPWTECYALAAATFGSPTPTFRQMVVANPRAVLAHMSWNLALVPAGLQLALFNRTWGGANPDYAPVEHPDSALAVVLSGAALVVTLLAARALWRDRRQWWQAWYRSRAMLWGAMASISVVSLPVILTQRPRPSYLFGLTVCLMAVCASAVQILTRRWSGWHGRAAAAIVLVSLIVVSPYYAEHRSSRPLMNAYRALRPVVPVLNRLNGRVVLGDFAWELQSYLGLVGAASYDSYDFLMAAQSAGGGLERALDDTMVSALFVQPRIRGDLSRMPGGDRLLQDPEAHGWQKRMLASNGGAEWILLFR